MKLYEIAEEIRAILETGATVDQETGEIIEGDDLAARLDTLNMELDGKLENLACYVKDLRAEAQALRTEEASLKARRQAKEKRAEGLAAYLSRVMQANGKAKFESARCSITQRTSRAVEVLDAHQLQVYADIDPQVMRHKDPEINKEYIARQFKAGTNIPGVQITERVSVVIK